jgi:hypothetical protein
LKREGPDPPEKINDHDLFLAGHDLLEADRDLEVFI